MVASSPLYSVLVYSVHCINNPDIVYVNPDPQPWYRGAVVLVCIKAPRGGYLTSERRPAVSFALHQQYGPTVCPRSSDPS